MRTVEEGRWVQLGLLGPLRQAVVEEVNREEIRFWVAPTARLSCCRPLIG
jgi:hypothetical protein